MTRSPTVFSLVALFASTFLSLHASVEAHAAEGYRGNIRRRVSSEDLQEYYDYMEQFGVNSTNNIIGGSDTTHYPWFVQFASRVCGGSLISPSHVLTSATCLHFTGIPSLVRVGATTSRDGILRQVECARTHPGYLIGQGTILGDLAILKLVTPVHVVTPVALNTDLAYPVNGGQKLTALGMGFTRTTGRISHRLQKVDLDFVPMDECQTKYQSDSIVRRGTHLCGQGKDRGICTGDSGGPLVESNSVQVGVSAKSIHQTSA
jgi:trypsin